jgi:dihydroflavonol-4-reductase
MENLAHSVYVLLCISCIEYLYFVQIEAYQLAYVIIAKRSHISVCDDFSFLFRIVLPYQRHQYLAKSQNFYCGCRIGHSAYGGDQSQNKDQCAHGRNRRFAGSDVVSRLPHTFRHDLGLHHDRTCGRIGWYGAVTIGRTPSLRNLPWIFIGFFRANHFVFLTPKAHIGISNLNLVTGATGIVGSHVLLALLQDHQEVRACRQANSDIEKVRRLFSYYSDDSEILFSRIQWVNADVKDIYSLEDAMMGVDCVYHCAGYVSFNKRDRKKLFEINEKGTRNVVNACLLRKVPALCHVSSIAAIHNLDYGLVLDETVFWKRSGRESDYAISKYNAEREVWRGIEEGLQAVIVNPAVIISPLFWNQSSGRLIRIASGRNPFYTRGLAGYVAAKDVAATMVLLVKGRHFGHRYILSEGSYSYHQILSKISNCLGKRPPIIETGSVLLRIGAFFEKVFCVFTGREERITKELVNSAFNKQRLSNEKVKMTLQIQFQPIFEALEQACAAYLLEG